MSDFAKTVELLTLLAKGTAPVAATVFSYRITWQGKYEWFVINLQGKVRKLKSGKRIFTNFFFFFEC